MNDLTVEKVYEGKRVTHFRVSRGEAGAMVTVRVSDFGVYCCLTCIAIDCVHAKAVEAHDRRQAERTRLNRHRYEDPCWRTIATQFDGVLIPTYQWDCRHDVMWYYGWDCASGCIWNLDAIAAVRHVASLAAPGRADD